MSQKNMYRLDISRWSVERCIFLIAGMLVALFSILGFILNPAFHYASLFVAGMLVFFSLTGYCPMAILVDTILKK